MSVRIPSESADIEAPGLGSRLLTLDAASPDAPSSSSRTKQRGSGTHCLYLLCLYLSSYFFANNIVLMLSYGLQSVWQNTACFLRLRLANPIFSLNTSESRQRLLCYSHFCPANPHDIRAECNAAGTCPFGSRCRGSYPTRSSINQQSINNVDDT